MLQSGLVWSRLWSKSASQIKTSDTLVIIQTEPTTAWHWILILSVFLWPDRPRLWKVNNSSLTRVTILRPRKRTELDNSIHWNIQNSVSRPSCRDLTDVLFLKTLMACGDSELQKFNLRFRDGKSQRLMREWLADEPPRLYGYRNLEFTWIIQVQSHIVQSSKRLKVHGWSGLMFRLDLSFPIDLSELE